MPDIDRLIAGLRCRDLLFLLPDYVDGVLSDQEVGRVDAHLGGCAYCAKFGGEYGHLVGELRRHPEAPMMSDEVRERLASRMEAMWAGEREGET